MRPFDVVRGVWRADAATTDAEHKPGTPALGPSHRSGSLELPWRFFPCRTARWGVRPQPLRRTATPNARPRRTAATASGRATSQGRLFALAAPHIRHRACEFFTAGATFPMPVPSHGAPYDPILRPTVLLMQQVIEYSMKTMVIGCKKSSIEVGSLASGQICPRSAQPDWRALAPHLPQDNARECRREARGHRVGLGGRLHEPPVRCLGPLHLPVKSKPPGSSLKRARLIACEPMDAHARPLARSHALAHRVFW